MKLSEKVPQIDRKVCLVPGGKNDYQKNKDQLTPPTVDVRDAQELLSSKPKQPQTFPKIVFSDDTPSTKTPSIQSQSPATLMKTTTPEAHAEGIDVVAATKTQLSIEVHETNKYCASRMDPNNCSQGELNPNVEPDEHTANTT